MIGPGEALLRIALAAKEIRLPRAVGGDAGHFVDFGLVGNRVGGVGRARADQQVDLVAKDQFGGDFGRAAAARLAVLADDLDLVGLAAICQAFAENAAHLLKNEAVGFAKASERACLWADVADLDDGGLRLRWQGEHGGRGDGANAGFDERAAGNFRDTAHCLLPVVSHASQESWARAFFRCCKTLVRSAVCSSGLHLRKPSPDLNPSLPSFTSFSR